MQYLRTDEEITTFQSENKIESDLCDYFEDQLGFSYIGKFESIDGAVISTTHSAGINNTLHSKFQITNEVIDFVINKKILSDSIVRDVMKWDGDTILLYAKMEKGEIIDLIAVNEGNFMDKHLSSLSKKESHA